MVLAKIGEEGVKKKGGQLDGWPPFLPLLIALFIAAGC
jgi:hypothetical protein